MSRIQFAALAFLTTMVAGLLVVLGVQLTRRFSARTIRLIGLLVFTIYGVLCLVQPRAWLISDMIVVLVAVFAGRLVAGGLRSKGAVIAFLITAGVVDFWSFSGGLTHRIVTAYQAGQSALLLYLSVSVPVGSTLVPIVGVGDFLIVAAVVAGLTRVGYLAAEVAAVVLGALLGALGVGLAVGGVGAVPILALAVVIYVAVRSIPHRAVLEVSSCSE